MPLAGPDGIGFWRIRRGRVSQPLPTPARSFHSRSRFQIRSPARARPSIV